MWTGENDSNKLRVDATNFLKKRRTKLFVFKNIQKSVGGALNGLVFISIVILG